MKTCAAAALGFSALVLVASGCATSQKPAVPDKPAAESTAAKKVAPTLARAKGNHPPTDEPSDVSSTQPLTLAPQVPAEVAPFNAADALRRTTTAYSKEMEASIASAAQLPRQPATETAAVRKKAIGTASVVAKPTVAPRGSGTPDNAGVEFVNPNDLRLSYSDNSERSPERSKIRPAMLESSPSAANPPVETPIETVPSADANAASSLSTSGMERNSTSANPVTGESLDNFSLKLEKRVKDNPRDVADQLDLQLMKFVHDDQVPDLAAIATLPVEDRELVSSLIDGLSNFRSALRQDNNTLLSKKVRPLLEMSDRLRTQADLTIPNIALCRAVRTFGEYDPIEPAKFTAGKPHEVILYCELENFSSQQNAQHEWETKVTKDAVLYAEGGVPIWSDTSETVTDTSRRRRHDFFLVKKLTLPPTLQPGRYLLKVSIVDDQVSRIAEATTPLVIVAQ